LIENQVALPTSFGWPSVGRTDSGRNFLRRESTVAARGAKVGGGIGFALGHVIVKGVRVVPLGALVRI
jgi:hypothetical protein